jgi:high-affinity Fe2+/Pb2+ permease
VLLIYFLSIFNKFEKKKRQLQREDTQKEDIKNNYTYVNSKIFKWSMVWL